MKRILVFAAVVAFCACGEKKPDTSAAASTANETTAKPDVSVVTPPPAPVEKSDTLCYEFRFKKDVNTVQLIMTGDKITGSLDYNPWEKDSAHGKLTGTKTGNDVTAIYDYVIEGSNQKEEVHFRLAGDKLMRASGPMSEKAGVMTIKDLAKAKYSESFTKVNCMGFDAMKGSSPMKAAPKMDSKMAPKMDSKMAPKSESKMSPKMENH